MKVFQLNAYFSILFIFWCFAAFHNSSYFYNILGSAVKWIKGLYLIAAFAVYRNIWANKNEKYARKCFPISIAGYAAISIAQISACFYCVTYFGYYWPGHEAKIVLASLIPSLPLGLFGFALSFYCNLKLRIPYIYYKRVEYFALFPIYAMLTMALSSYSLYFIAENPGTIFKHEAVFTHSSIVVASFLIIAGFVSFKKEIFLAAFCLLTFAGCFYVKIVFSMGYYFLVQQKFSNNLKADYSFVIFHIFTVLIMVFTGMLMCFYAFKSDCLPEKSNKKHKIFVVSNEILPLSLSQKC